MERNANIEADYWEQNPEMALLFSDFKPKPNSAKIMWCIYMCYDPRSSFSMGDPEERLSKVRSEYFDFNPNEYMDVIIRYERLIPECEATLAMMERDFKNMQKLAAELKMDTKNVDIKIKIGKSVPGIIDSILDAKKKAMDFRSSQGGEKARGNYTQSMAEMGVFGKH